MFVMSFDINVADAERHHPRGSRRAYSDVGVLLKGFGFERIQKSVYAAQTDDMASLFSAILALRDLQWFGLCVNNIRAFKMENGSDFTMIVKGEAT